MGFNIHKSLGVTPLKSLVITGFLSVSAVFAASYPPTRDTTGTGLAMTSSPYATAIGKAVLDNGGNAIDAAVAVGYALAVVHPAAGNIGGGGFAVIHLANGENITLDAWCGLRNRDSISFICHW